MAKQNHQHDNCVNWHTNIIKYCGAATCAPWTMGQEQPVLGFQEPKCYLPWISGGSPWNSNCVGGDFLQLGNFGWFMFPWWKGMIHNIDNQYDLSGLKPATSVNDRQSFSNDGFNAECSTVVMTRVAVGAGESDRKHVHDESFRMMLPTYRWPTPLLIIFQHKQVMICIYLTGWFFRPKSFPTSLVFECFRQGQLYRTLWWSCGLLGDENG